ncbi:MAG: DUF4268 domain-containing protein [Cytophagales bacterium]|nr:DUF4268 domain-containing protein [Cytophagales bacterium]
MEDIKKITRVPIKEAFRYEDKHLTPWLTDNIDVVSEAIGIELTSASKEQSTGNFHVDIKAETDDGRIVVIENQYGSSNHDHLGKLITYLTSFEAQIGIWIVEGARTEHINAINWLNESENGCDFYLLTIEAIRIGESNLAPLLTKIIGPSEEAKQIGKVKKEDSERHRLRYKFWVEVLDLCKQKNINTFDAISPTQDAWIGASTGYRGLTYVFWINQHSYRIELRIDRGKGSDEENLEILSQLRDHRVEVEQAFGEPLAWEELENYRVCSIRQNYDEGGYKDTEDRWSNAVESIVDRMGKLIKATRKPLKSLKIQ